MDAIEGARYIVKKLVEAGYKAYFAGGWVRDYVMKHPSDDIDIATDAPPEAIAELFPRTIKVGMAFGVVIVPIKNHQYEVATFRKDIGYVEGRRPARIELSTPQEDALRRDFTINGMFYDPLEETIHDFVNGAQDITRGIIRTIGDPNERFYEDRLRMIRAIRFSSRFDFPIDLDTQQAIREHASLLFPAVAMERVWQEFNKMSQAPRFDKAIIEMHRLGLLGVIFPSLQNVPLQYIEERVFAFKNFPKGSPTILYILQLFPDTPLDELLELCQYLRISAQESKMVEFAVKGKNLLAKEEKEEVPNTEWAYFYADRLFKICFDAISAGFSHEKHEETTGRHKARHERLLPHVQKIAEKKPVVTAAILKDYGIVPGKNMGLLLKKAEEIAISQDLHDAEQIVEILKHSTLWPK